MIAWQAVQTARFERAVQAMLKQRHPGLRSYDGTGGDGGKDARLVTADGDHVFEVKSFSGSLNGSRRRQIEKSLRRAVETTPALRRWTLVIPRNMTPDRADGRYSDEGWFTTTLAECAPRVTLEWFGVDQLDLAAAGDPAFQRYVDGQYAQVMRQVVDGGSGSTVLAQGATDLFRRNQICREQIDAISQHWTLDFAVTGNTYISTLEEKYSGAAEDDPVKLLPTFMFPSDDDPDAMAVRQGLDQALDFGGSVDVPARYVATLDIQASDEVKHLLGWTDDRSGQVSFISMPQPMEPPVRGAFSVLDGVDRCVASVPVYFRERVGGRLGVTLSGTDASSLLVLTVVLPLPEAQDASGVQRRTGLTITAADVEGFDLDDASVVVDALAAADAGTRLQVAVGSAALTVAESSDEHRFPHAVRLQAVVRALQRLSENCGRRLNFPRGMTDAQADMLVTAARLLDGVQVTVPARRWSLSLLPQCVKGMVAAITDDGQFLEIRPDAALVAGDMEIPYGPLVQWAPAVRLLNRAVLEAHNGIDPIKAEFEIIDGRHVCWLPRERAEELAQHNGT